MKIAILKETLHGENRVASSPEVVKKLVALGHSVCVENGAGIAASYSDAAYAAAGASTVSRTEAMQADIVLCVRTPQEIGRASCRERV